MALAENIDKIVATSPALKRLTPERRLNLAQQLTTAERQFLKWTTYRAPHRGLTVGAMRRDLCKAERLAKQLNEVMQTPTLRHLTLGRPCDFSAIEKHLGFASSLFKSLEKVSKVSGMSQEGRGGSRHHGDLVLRELVGRLIHVYEAATGKKARASVSPWTKTGGPAVRYIAACLRALGVSRPYSDVAIRNLIHRAAPRPPIG